MATITIPRSTSARFRATLTDSLLMTRRNLMYWWRLPEEVVGSLAFPLVSVLLFGYVFGSAMTVPGGGDYKEFLLPGLFAMTMVFGVVGTIGAVVADKDRGVTDRFMAMPMSSSAILTGRSVTDMVRAAADLAVLLGVGLLVGWRPHGGLGGTLAAVGLLLLLRFALVWIGIYVGLVLRSTESVALIYPLVLPFAMVSNAFVAPSLMPSWLGPVAEWNPMSSTVAAIREQFGNPGMGGDSWVGEHSLLLAIALPVVLILVFFPLAVRRYRASRG